MERITYYPPEVYWFRCESAGTILTGSDGYGEEGAAGQTPQVRSIGSF